MLRGKVCRTVISLPTHACPVSESDFLVFSAYVSVFMQPCVRENKRECVPDTETLVFSAQAADFSTIISWIVLHAQHLSRAHTKLPLSHTQTQPLYGHYCQADAVQPSLTCSLSLSSISFLLPSFFVLCLSSLISTSASSIFPPPLLFSSLLYQSRQFRSWSSG